MTVWQNILQRQAFFFPPQVIRCEISLDQDIRINYILI